MICKKGFNIGSKNVEKNVLLKQEEDFLTEELHFSKTCLNSEQLSVNVRSIFKYHEPLQF